MPNPTFVLIALVLGGFVGNLLVLLTGYGFPASAFVVGLLFAIPIWFSAALRNSAALALLGVLVWLGDGFVLYYHLVHI